MNEKLERHIEDLHKIKEGNFFEITRSKNEKDKLFIEILGSKESLTYGISFLFEVQINNNYGEETVKIKSLTPIHFPLINNDRRVGIYGRYRHDNSVRFFSDNLSSLYLEIRKNFSPNDFDSVANREIFFDEEKFEREKKNFYVGWKPQFISYYQESVQSEIKSLFISFTFLKKFDENNEKKTNLSFLPRSIVNLIANQLIFHSFLKK